MWPVAAPSPRGKLTRAQRDAPMNAKWWRDQRKRQRRSALRRDGRLRGSGHRREPPRPKLRRRARQRRCAPCGRRACGSSTSASPGRGCARRCTNQVPNSANCTPTSSPSRSGANDIAQLDPKRFERELQDLCAAFPRTRWWRTCPLLLGRAGTESAVANAIVRTVVADHSLTVVPLSRRHETSRRLAHRTDGGRVDFFHPNDRGYSVWASAFISSPPQARSIGCLAR